MVGVEMDIVFFSTWMVGSFVIASFACFPIQEVLLKALFVSNGSFWELKYTKSALKGTFEEK